MAAKDLLVPVLDLAVWGQVAGPGLAAWTAFAAAVAAAVVPVAAAAADRQLVPVWLVQMLAEHCL